MLVPLWGERAPRVFTLVPLLRERAPRVSRLFRSGAKGTHVCSRLFRSGAKGTRDVSSEGFGTEYDLELELVGHPARFDRN